MLCPSPGGGPQRPGPVRGAEPREEENGILAHMWPMARSAPHSRTAAAVCLADKLCATAEVLGIWRRTALYRTACPGPSSVETR